MEGMPSSPLGAVWTRFDMRKKGISRRGSASR